MIIFKYCQGFGTKDPTKLFWSCSIQNSIFSDIRLTNTAVDLVSHNCPQNL